MGAAAPAAAAGQAVVVAGPDAEKVAAVAAAAVVAVAAVAAMAADTDRGVGGTHTGWAYSPTACTTRTPTGWGSKARRGVQAAVDCATMTPPMAMTAAGGGSGVGGGG